MIANGNPTARIIITMVGRFSGRFNGSARLLTSSMITNAAEAYTVITCTTRRLFSSCHNWDSLLGLPAIKDFSCLLQVKALLLMCKISASTRFLSKFAPG